MLPWIHNAHRYISPLAQCHNRKHLSQMAQWLFPQMIDLAKVELRQAGTEASHPRHGYFFGLVNVYIQWGWNSVSAWALVTTHANTGAIFIIKTNLSFSYRMFAGDAVMHIWTEKTKYAWTSYVGTGRTCKLQRKAQTEIWTSNTTVPPPTLIQLVNNTLNT